MLKTVFSSLVLLVLFCTLSFGQSNSQKIVDDKILTEFFKDNKIKPKSTASGLYYVITKQGEGPNAKAGQRVNMKYLGKFLDGKKFDANVDDNFNTTRPFSFVLGIGQVIRGWDEGVQLLNPGTRATFYLPSSLAYGPSGTGPIPPNSVLVFDVELISVSN